MVIGIDATNLGIGGGITHLKEILSNFDKIYFKDEIDEIVVFSSQKVIDQLEEDKFIKKCSFPNLNKGLIRRVLFQLFQFDNEIKKRCDILFSITGDYIGGFDLVVGMSRNMLLYERDIWKEIKQPKEIIRFWVNFKKQQKCFNNAKGIIFISNYANKYVSTQLNLESKCTTIIHHGIATRFLGGVKEQKPIESYSLENPFKILYVSSVHVYKHQVEVIRAIASLRKRGVPIELNLVGSILFESSGKKMLEAIVKEDPNKKFIKYHGNIPYSSIEGFYLNADGIVFASTCENMPNILIESMASGVPIASSDKEPMPEFLKAGGFYFNSKSVQSIENAINELIDNPEKRKRMSNKNIEEVKKYSWERTSKDTFKFILELYNKNKKHA